MKMLKYILVISLLQLGREYVNAQITTVISELHDTLQPKIINLANVPARKKQQTVAPTVHTFAPNIAQGQAFFTTYNGENGLPMGGINYGNTTMCDSEGNLWFGTSGGGVSKYDGKSFITYTTEQGLTHNVIRSIIEDKNGNFWFGTYGGGVSKYDGKSFITYTTEQGLANDFVSSIAEDKNGNLWFGTYGGGVSKYDGKFFITYTTEQGLADNFIRSIIEDKSGNLWFGTHGGISKYNEESFITYTTEQGLAHNFVSSIAEDKNGIFWFGTYGGISKYNGETFVTYTTEQGLADNVIRSVIEDKSGNLWFGTSGGGVSKYDGETFITYTTKQGLAGDFVRSIAEDKSGNLWFGTAFGGVSKYEGKSFITYTTEQGLAGNSVLCVAEDKSGNLWFGTYDGGVSKYDGKSFITYTTEHGLASNSIKSIAEDKSGNLWFGTSDRGVSKYNGDSFITYTTEDGLANNSIFSIIEDKSGNLWFGTYQGISKYDGKSFINYTTDQGLANNTVVSITEDKSGNLWFGTFGGASKYDGKSFITYTIDQGLADNIVFSITEDKSGNLWFGTFDGLSLFSGGVVTEKDKVDTNKLFITYTTKDGLPGNVIMGIKETRKGDLLLGTNYGLALLKGVNEERIIKKGIFDIEIYNQFTGYPIRDVNGGANNNGAMCIENQGDLWIGHGNNGVTRVDLDAINKNKTLPKVLINKIKISEEDVCYYSLKLSFKDSIILSQQEIATYGEVLNEAGREALQQRFSGIEFDDITKFYPLPENLILPYKNNALTFEFNAIETGRNFMINYQYMLKGMDDDWGQVTKKQEATYNNLSSGEYTFLLKGQSPLGVWSKPVEFSFTILSPWYKTWWMYCLYLILVVSFIWILIKMETKRLKKRQKELEIEVGTVTKEIRKQKEQVEKAHKEITDSINYAERIQRSFLAAKELLTENLQDYFVFFQPKEAVSGDFYWAKKLTNGNFVMVNADSTGHGVPGAIMSILNISSIEQAIKEGLTSPSDIFNATRKTIIERLQNDGSDEGGKDGMDASIISFNADKSKFIYTAAKNPIWIVRNQQLIEIKPEKMPVGKHDNDVIPFVGGEFETQKEDVIYTITDGFQDQFGGKEGKKFKIAPFKDFLVSISQLPMQEQGQRLEQMFNEWKGKEEQVDDVCVIGIKI